MRTPFNKRVGYAPTRPWLHGSPANCHGKLAGLRLIQQPQDIARLPFGGSDQPIMRDPHRMARRLDLAAPHRQKIKQHRKVRRKIIFLPDVQLEQRRMIGPVVMDFEVVNP